MQRAHGKRTLALSLGVGLIGPVGAPSANAATTIGQTFAPTASGAANVTYLQTATPGGEYRAPAAGVVTSWSHQASAAAQQLKLKVARPAGGNDFTLVGDSALETIIPGALNTFPTRISVQAGDVIGLFEVTTAPAALGSLGSEYGYHILVGDPSPGTTSTYTASVTVQLDISATLEPDADNDGFGDETQDLCVGQGGEADGCPAPDTTITKRPKDKTKKKKATFEFSSSVAGASFECSLDGAAFAPCISPHEVKVKKGKHSFEVRAVAHGLTDGSTASDDWKVKKRK